MSTPTPTDASFSQLWGKGKDALFGTEKELRGGKRWVLALSAVALCWLAYQCQTSVLLSADGSSIYRFGIVLRPLIIGVLAAALIRAKLPSWTAALVPGAAILLGMLTWGVFDAATTPGANLISFYYGDFSLLRVVGQEIALAALVAVACCELIRRLRLSVVAVIITAALCCMLAFGLHFGAIVGLVNTPGSPEQRLLHAQSSLVGSYDGTEYADTIRRMKNGEDYYHAYQGAWLDDKRPEDGKGMTFSSVLNIRPPALPTLLALLPGGSLNSVFVWWGVLVACAGIAAALFLGRFSDPAVALVGFVTVTSYYLLVGGQNIGFFDWLMAETLVSIPLLATLAALVWRKYWAAAVFLVLAVATREFALAFLPIFLLLCLFETTTERKRGLIALAATLVVVIGFYAWHFSQAGNILVAAQDSGGLAGIVTKLGGYLKGNAQWYVAFLRWKMQIGDIMILPFGYLVTFAPILGLGSALLLKERRYQVALAALSVGIGVFFRFGGETEWNTYWAPLGVPILILMTILLTQRLLPAQEKTDG